MDLNTIQDLTAAGFTFAVNPNFYLVVEDQSIFVVIDKFDLGTCTLSKDKYEIKETSTGRYTFGFDQKVTHQPAKSVYKICVSREISERGKPELYKPLLVHANNMASKIHRKYPKAKVTCSPVDLFTFKVEASFASGSQIQFSICKYSKKVKLTGYSLTNVNVDALMAALSSIHI